MVRSWIYARLRLLERMGPHTSNTGSKKDSGVHQSLGLPCWSLVLLLRRNQPPSQTAQQARHSTAEQTGASLQPLQVLAVRALTSTAMAPNACSKPTLYENRSVVGKYHNKAVLINKRFDDRLAIITPWSKPPALKLSPSHAITS